ncbi:MAG: hypothetical protein AAFZ17_01085 [Cyanobacteria bacterium J06650_10]
MKKKLYAAQAFAAISVLSVVLPASANTGLILQDLEDFSDNASYSQGSDGHVIIDCWRQPWGDDGEAVIAEWRLRSYRGPFVYVSGAVSFTESAVPLPLNGSPVGFSVPWSNVTSGSEELYLDEPVGAGVVSASIGGYVELGIERGVIIPTTTNCPVRAN